MEVDISTIKEGERARKDYGDMSLIENSIKQIGLLQPIVIDANYNLVCGGRRIKAFKNLGFKKIPARIVNLEHIILGEYAENEVRKDFTHSERVAIGKKLEERLSGRKGSNQYKQKVDSLNLDEAKKRTDQLAAKKAGYVSKDTYRQAKKVVETAQPELVDAVDEGRVSVSAAATIADLPSADQILLASKGKEKEAQQAAKDIRENKSSNKKDTIKAAKQQITEASKRSVKDSPPKIIHADCLQIMDSRVEDNSVDLLVTDPPYSTDVADIEDFVSKWLPLTLKKVKPEGRAYICIGAYPRELKAYLDCLLSHDKFTLDNPLIWTYRNTLGQTPKHKYNLNYQVILHLYGENSNPLDNSITNEMFSVQDINAPDGRQGDRYHTWQKPDELAYRFIRHSSNENDLVLDPFACTGTFLLAAAKFKRQAIGFEIEKSNLDIALERGCYAIS